MSSHSLIVARAVSLGAPCHTAWPRARDKWPREKEEIHQTTCRAIILPVMQRRRQPATKNLTTKCLRCIAQIVLGNFRWAEHQRATEGEWWVSTAEYTYICIWCDDDEARAWDPQARHHTHTHMRLRRRIGGNENRLSCWVVCLWQTYYPWMMVQQAKVFGDWWTLGSYSDIAARGARVRSLWAFLDVIYIAHSSHRLVNRMDWLIVWPLYRKTLWFINACGNLLEWGTINENLHRNAVIAGVS